MSRYATGELLEKKRAEVRDMLPDSIPSDSISYMIMGGNPPHCPYLWGWSIKSERYTTPNERKALRAAGFVFAGMKWYKHDGW